MAALKAHVRNGRIVIDEPTDLPDGTELYLVPLDDDDDLDDAEREALHRSLERGSADIAAGRSVDAASLLAKLNGRS